MVVADNFPSVYIVNMKSKHKRILVAEYWFPPIYCMIVYEGKIFISDHSNIIRVLNSKGVINTKYSGHNEPPMFLKTDDPHLISGCSAGVILIWDI